MGELFKSGIDTLNEVFQEVFYDLAIVKGNNAKSPAEIAKEFPIEIISYKHIFDVLNEVVQKRGYGHFGCFFKYEPSSVFRDGRINQHKVYTDFRQIVCMRGEVYEYCTQKGNSSNTFTFPNGEWRERKVYQDVECKWHLWDGSYNIKVWVDEKKQVFTTSPSKPTKVYPAE